MSQLTFYYKNFKYVIGNDTYNNTPDIRNTIIIHLMNMEIFLRYLDRLEVDKKIEFQYNTIVCTFNHSNCRFQIEYDDNFLILFYNNNQIVCEFRYIKNTFQHMFPYIYKDI